MTRLFHSHADIEGAKKKKNGTSKPYQNDVCVQEITAGLRTLGRV